MAYAQFQDIKRAYMKFQPAPAATEICSISDFTLNMPDKYAQHRLDENNVGHRLLCKMGWQGSGGIGKYLHGIAQPVTANGQNNRSGIGHHPSPQSSHHPSSQSKLISTLIDEQNEQNEPSLVQGFCLHIENKEAELTGANAAKIIKQSCDAGLC